MTIEIDIKKKLKDVTIIGWERMFFKVILGEFNRVDDGKPCNDTQCIAVVRKLIKNSNIVLKNKVNDTTALKEIEFLQQFLPKMASKELMVETVKEMKATIKYKNVMQLMKPIIEYLFKIGFDVDKKELSILLKE